MFMIWEILGFNFITKYDTETTSAAAARIESENFNWSPQVKLTFVDFSIAELITVWYRANTINFLKWFFACELSCFWT